MAIEEWDNRRGRWILYRNQEDRSKDCDRYPIEKLPRKIFLDTSVINFLVEYPDQIFENAPLPHYADDTRLEDIDALCHIFATGMRANWHIVASLKVIEEINNTKNAERRDNLNRYAAELIDIVNDDHNHALNLGRRIKDSAFLEALPDIPDRELVGNAIGLGCDVFCTRDRKSIVTKRDKLRNIGIRIMTPREWWSHIKPWAGLWL